MLESVGTGALVTALVTMGGLFVRSLLAQQKTAEEVAAATAKRYEAEIERLNREREAERDRLIAEVTFWRDRALAAGG